MSGLQGHQAFESADFRRCVKGAAFQYSFPRLLQDFQVAFPGTRVMHTENVCHNGDNSWSQAASQFVDVLSYLNANMDGQDLQDIERAILSCASCPSIKSSESQRIITNEILRFCTRLRQFTLDAYIYRFIL